MTPRSSLVWKQVYLIESIIEGYWKIGITGDLFKRLKEINWEYNTGRSFLPVVSVIRSIRLSKRGAELYEQQLHHVFRHQRIKGEYFNFSNISEVLPYFDPKFVPYKNLFVSDNLAEKVQRKLGVQGYKSSSYERFERYRIAQRIAAPLTMEAFYELLPVYAYTLFPDYYDLDHSFKISMDAIREVEHYKFSRKYGMSVQYPRFVYKRGVIYTQ